MFSRENNTRKITQALSRTVSGALNNNPFQSDIVVSDIIVSDKQKSLT